MYYGSGTVDGIASVSIEMGVHRSLTF